MVVTCGIDDALADVLPDPAQLMPRRRDVSACGQESPGVWGYAVGAAEESWGQMGHVCL